MTYSLSRFLSLETETGLTEDDDEENEVNEEMLRVMMGKERDHDHTGSNVDDWIKVTRSEAIQWIINMRSCFGLQYQTAYMCIMYIDQFLSKGFIGMKSDNQWAIRLLSVACLSLAAKMKENEFPSLSLLSTQGYNYKSNVIQRMELLVLTTLDWRMCLITPFDFMNCFISCFSTESPKRHLISLTTQIVFAATNDMNIMEHLSSTIAMAATLMVMDQNLTRESLDIKLKTTWVNQLLDHEDVYACYSRMLELQPVQVKLDLTTSSENPPGGTKRKRLAFNENAKTPNR